MLSAMDINHTALERAFQIARSGKVTSMQELRALLSKEGYTASQVDGPALGRQLREIIRKSQGDAVADRT